MKKRSAPTRAFTIVELLVAISITVLMMFLVSRIFFDTTNAVSVGVATSVIVENSRTISDQLQRDTDPTDVMIGPSNSSPTAFLVILNKLYHNAKVTLADGSTALQDVRSDQLVFFRKADGLNPICPQSASTFSNNRSGAYARIWYGHVLRTAADGTDAGDLGTAGPNEIANNWCLGRQALLLDVNTATAFGGSEIYVNGAAVSDLINTTSAQLFRGFTDVSNKKLYGTGAIASPTDAIIGNNNFYPIYTGLGTYKSAAYAYTFGAERLRTNPTPTQGGVSVLQVAQMHSYLMGNVSDFVVEFAGATTPPYGGTPDVDASFNIKWYGYWFNTLADGQRDPANPAGTISYDSKLPTVYQPPIDGSYTPYDFAPGLTNADAGFVWQHDDATPATSFWPCLIRIRYRLHDARGRLQSTVNGNAVAGRWFEQIIKVNRDPS